MASRNSNNMHRSAMALLAALLALQMATDVVHGGREVGSPEGGRERSYERSVPRGRYTSRERSTPRSYALPTSFTLSNGRMYNVVEQLSDPNVYQVTFEGKGYALKKGCDSSELAALRACTNNRCANVAKLIDSDEQKGLCVMELGYRTLKHPELEAAKGTLRGALGQLHKAGYAHGDIGDEHVMFFKQSDGKRVVKLIGLGSASAVNSQNAKGDFAALEQL